MKTPSDNSLPVASPGPGPYTSWRHSQPVRADWDAGTGQGESAGALSSNTAPANYIQPPQVAQIVAGGIDSLYLTFRGAIRPSFKDLLEEKKGAAQSADQALRNSAQITIGKWLFCVSPRGHDGYPYMLLGDFFDIQLSPNPESSRPLVLIKIKSELLWLSTPEDMLQETLSIIESFTLSIGNPRVSRADLCVDFVSPLEIGSIPDHAWVKRCKKEVKYQENGQLQTLYFGNPGKASIKARIYDKTAEMDGSNKSFFPDIWIEGGWDSVTKLWRLEFQLRNEFLSGSGVQTPSELYQSLDSLWTYCTNDWLRLSIPSETDTNQSRWPIHPLWSSISDFPSPIDIKQIPIDRTKHPHAPNPEWIYRHYFALLSSFMAVENLKDADLAIEALSKKTKSHFNMTRGIATNGFDAALQDRIREKTRRFNLRANPAPGSQKDGRLSDG